MAISTAGDLITKSAKKVGIQSLTTTQSAEALDMLNPMISFWGTEGLNYVVTSETLDIGTRTAEYTIGDNSADELMPNVEDRDFSAASAWTDVDLAVTGSYGETTDLSLLAGAAGAGDYCTLPVASAPTTIGKTYRMTYDLANLVGSWTLMDFTGVQTIGTISADVTQGEIEWTATTTGGYRLVAVSNNAAGDFDNFTLKVLGDINTVRPVSIERCFLRDSEGFDWPVRKMSSEEYNTITDKDVSTRPTKVYFLPEFPLAKVIFNSVPDTSYTAYFEFNKGFAAFASTTATLGATFPNENLEGVIYNLAVAIGENWDRKISPTVMYRAKETKDALDSRNAANRPVPKAKFDFSSGRSYNISTDY